MKKIIIQIILCVIALTAVFLFGCKTNESCSFCSSCNTLDVQKKSLAPEFDPLETTISLDPMDRDQWFEREEFLRQFE